MKWGGLLPKINEDKIMLKAVILLLSLVSMSSYAAPSDTALSKVAPSILQEIQANKNNPEKLEKQLEMIEATSPGQYRVAMDVIHFKLQAELLEVMTKLANNQAAIAKQLAQYSPDS